MYIETIQPISDATPNEMEANGGTGTHASCVANKANTPNIPNKDSYLFFYAGAGTERFDLEQVTNNNVVRNVVLNFYANIDILGAGTLYLFIQGAGDPVIVPIELVTEEKWYEARFDDVWFSKEEINQLTAGFAFLTEAEIYAYNYALNLNLEYDEEPNAEPLPKRSPKMSGYNYFIKNYIKRKNLSLPPYRLPTGEIY